MAKTKSEEIREKIGEIIERGKDISNSDFNYIAAMTGHDTAIVLEEIIGEMIVIEKIIKRILDKTEMSWDEEKVRAKPEVKFKKGRWTMKE